MKLICDSPPSRHSLMLLSSWGFGLHSSRRNLSAQAGLKFWMIWKSYMWIAEWRIKWRMIIFIYATFAVAKRKPEKKKKKASEVFRAFFLQLQKLRIKLRRSSFIYLQSYKFSHHRQIDQRWRTGITQPQEATRHNNQTSWERLGNGCYGQIVVHRRMQPTVKWR